MADTDMKESDVLLLILDISGYTKFMVSTSSTLVHGQLIISELIEALIDRAQLPLRILELEGDAILLFAFREPGEAAWEGFRLRLFAKLEEFVMAFFVRMKEIMASNLCSCSACKHLTSLRIKAIVHSGKAVEFRLRQFLRLSGPDVITVHRLLKNSIPSNQYFLLTESAWELLDEEHRGRFTAGRETYGDIGTVKTHVYIIDAPRNIGQAGVTPSESIGWSPKAIVSTMRMMVRSMLVRLGLKRMQKFRHLPISE
jgi:Protein of unknown function (DUF2652)